MEGSQSQQCPCSVGAAGSGSGSLCRSGVSPLSGSDQGLLLLTGAQAGLGSGRHNESLRGSPAPELPISEAPFPRHVGVRAGAV